MMTQKTRSPRHTSDPTSLMIDTALTLAARDGWAHLSISEIANAAGVPLSDALTRFSSKQVLLNTFRDQIDKTVIDGTDTDTFDQTARDRLFDIIMRRLDALGPWKEGIAAISRDTLRDPLENLCCHDLNRSMGLMIECAGLSSTGLRGFARTHGLTIIYLIVLHRWLKDDSTDMAPTMAELDKKLKSIEQFVQRFQPNIPTYYKKTANKN